MERSITWFFLVLVVYCCCCVASLSTDQSALLALKARITSDPQNMILTNWSTTTPVCNWIGVTCAARHLRVAVLNISYFGLTGTIPPELGNLSFLVELQLTNNSFSGTLPMELARLRRLKLVSFEFNNFKGEIPSLFGSLSKLETFNLSGNQFSGTIPAAIFNLSALQVIDLSCNQLSGNIPPVLGNLSSLVELRLKNNHFSGTLPVELALLRQLKRVSFGINNFKGEIPSWFGSLPKLEIFNLYGNQFTGSIPPAIFNISVLQGVALMYNQLSGSILKAIGNLTMLKYLYLSYNNFEGTIPDEIGYLQNLEILVLDANNFNGLIPFPIFNLSSIIVISLPINQLSGRLPTNIGHGVPNLQTLFVGGNKLNGVIPNFISNASKITRLDLSSNSFSGLIPTTLCALPSLQLLHLRQNNLTIDTSTPEANILSCLPNLRNLWELSFSYNPINAMLPVSLGNLSTSLQYLDLGRSNMRGNIPNDIGNLINLIALYLEYNQLSGSIPTSIGRLGNLQGLHLNDNRFQGNIPDELCQLHSLDGMFLGGNQLSGSIPSCFGNLASLRTLSLGSNLLTSTLPSTLWGLTDILHINLSSNFLIGSLSAGIGNLRVVIDIDLSSNNFSGIIPSNIGLLGNLVNLSLSNNNLEGPIPNSFVDLVSLELLDLSRNNLYGVIPKSLETLLYLKYLNLSFNRLHGEIPTSGPFKNFSAQSFLSNDGLCGALRLDFLPCRNTTRQYSSTSRTSVLKYIISGILAAIFLVTFMWMLIQCKKGHVEVVIEPTLLPKVLRKKVSYQELFSVTNGFNETNLLGIGSFGSVYKGILSDGIDIAVKVFNLQLKEAYKSFDIECEMLCNVHHRNLIKIISSCNQSHFKALVLDYMPNGSLERLLYSEEYCSLNILERLNIMIDVASALEYLHHGYSIPVVHCDLKPSNILLDDDMIAHVADFGITKLLGGEDSMTETMTLATIGYMAPEYGMEGIVSRRGDVYSFGIVLIEIFTKKKPTDEMFGGEMSLKRWVANLLLSDAIVGVVDANLLREEVDHDFVNKKDCLSSIMRLALDCSAESANERISMQDAAVTLHKIKNNFLKNIAGV